MRTEAEIFATARDKQPFSNGTEGYAWRENWCDECHNPAEKAWQDYEEGKRKKPLKQYPGGCPLLRCALLGKTPTEWLEQPSVDGLMVLGDQYHCIEFRGPDDGRGGRGGGEPRPRREPPDMDGLFPRPERHVRMLKQSEPAREVIFA